MRAVSLPLIMLIAAYLSAAQAQPSNCLQCRAMGSFDCPKAILDTRRDGAISVEGTVVAVVPIECGTQLKVNVSRSSKASLPATIAIAVLPCVYWHGKVGGTVAGFVSDTPSSAGVYRAQICSWGNRG